MQTKMKECPHCGNKDEFQIVETVRRNLCFNFGNGEPCGGTEDDCIGKQPKTALCGKCWKRIKLKDLLDGS